MENKKEDRFIVSVKVGPKFQITIPAVARKMFNIKEGDTLMVMGDNEKGIALIKEIALLSDSSVETQKLVQFNTDCKCP